MQSDEFENTNGYRVITQGLENINLNISEWEDEGGAYHDSGWNQSWPDGDWKDSHH